MTTDTEMLRPQHERRVPRVVWIFLAFIALIVALPGFVIGMYLWDERTAKGYLRDTTDAIQQGDTVADVEAVLAEATNSATDPFTYFALIGHESSVFRVLEEGESVATVEGFWLNNGINCEADIVFVDGRVAEVSDKIDCEAGYYF